MAIRLRTALRIAVTIGLLSWLLARADLSRIGAALAETSPLWVAAALALHGVGILLSAERWRLLLEAQGTRTGLGFLAGSFLAGLFFNNFLPSTVGGDVVRARDTAPLAGSGAKALTVVLVERSSGIFVLGLFALAAPLFGRVALEGAGYGAAASVVAVLLAGLGAFAVLLRPRPLEALGRLAAPALRGARGRGGAAARAADAFEHLLETLRALADRPRALQVALLLAFALQANVILHYWCLAQALHLEVPLPAFFYIVPLATVVLLLPVSINGIGAREAVFAFFLGRHGVGLAEALAFSWVAYGLVLLLGLAGGAVYALRPDPGGAAGARGGDGGA